MNDKVEIENSLYLELLKCKEVLDKLILSSAKVKDINDIDEYTFISRSSAADIEFMKAYDNASWRKNNN